MTATMATRKFLTINEIQKEFLPISKKRIRALVKQHLNVKVIGSRMFVERGQLENLLSSTEQNCFPIVI